MSAIPDALADAIGIVIRQQREEWARERRQIETEARATIAEQRAEIIELKTMLKEAMANVKDGRDGKDGADGPPGPQGERGEPGQGITVEEVVPLVLERLPPPEKGDLGPQGEKGEPGEKGETGAPGAPGCDAELDFEYINRALADQVELRSSDLRGPQGPQGEPGRDGKSIDPDLIVNLVHETVASAIAALPPPEKGERGEPGIPGERGEKGEAGDRGEPGPKGDIGEKGESGLPGDHGEKGEPGERGDPGPQGDRGEKGESGLPGERGEKGERGDTGLAGRDAADIAGGFVNRDGHCILTLTDGRTLDFGEIVGKDGAPGRDGADGKDGRDGKDGLSFDAFQFEPSFDGVRTLQLRWSDAKGNEQVREIRFPFWSYREIWKADAQYEAGDTVRYGGSLWLAAADTSEKPGDGCKDWRLVARAGRDGRDGAPGAKGEKGDTGPPGPKTLITGKD